MDQPALCQAGGDGVIKWGMFSLHGLECYCKLLNATACLGLLAVRVHPFMAT